jgi:hypothetical protein
VWDAHRFEHLCRQPVAGGVRQAPPTALDRRPSLSLQQASPWALLDRHGNSGAAAFQCSPVSTTQTPCLQQRSRPWPAACLDVCSVQQLAGLPGPFAPLHAQRHTTTIWIVGHIAAAAVPPHTAVSTLHASKPIFLPPTKNVLPMLVAARKMPSLTQSPTAEHASE